MGSSAFTASPGFFSHWPRVASVMDSPSVGTTTSVAILFLFSARLAPRFGLAAIAQRLRDQGRLFGDVPLGKAGCGRSRRRSARISPPPRLHAGLPPAHLHQRPHERDRTGGG